MKVINWHVVAIALLAVLALMFGIFGTVAPPLAESVSPQQSYSTSSSSSVAHFQNPPTYDSGWVDITTKTGQYFTLKHNLNTTDVVVDITGKQSLDPMSGAPAWKRTYGGLGNETAESVVQTSDGGYALAGYTYSGGAPTYDVCFVKTDASGIVQWSKTYGGANDDSAFSVVQTSDGGYALAGYTSSFGAGMRDFWLIKTDFFGNPLWNRTYGGTSSDAAFSVIQTSDGGYALAGWTKSYGAGSVDMWVVKTDSFGNAQWNRTYGGTAIDSATSVVQTSDGGYALVGETESFRPGYDFWLFKTDSSGNMQWNKTYGTTYIEYCRRGIETNDGGYAIVGYTYRDSTNRYDIYLVKTDPAGNELWERTYGGTGDDQAESFVQTDDSGFALVGHTGPYGIGGSDFWLVKTDASGTIQWSQTYGGTSDDIAHSVVQTSDGGYAIAGSTSSFGAGGSDFWLVKVKPDMNVEHQRNLGVDADVGWRQTYGGAYSDIAYSLILTSDGGYALAGYTSSYGAGQEDFWLVKTDASGNMQWSQTYGGAYDDCANSLILTSDGGYALAGRTYLSSVTGEDLYFVKTDANGNTQWNKTYGRADDDCANSLILTSDGGYALAGYAYISMASVGDFWLIKTDCLGNLQWNQTYGGSNWERAYSLVQTSDGGYALAGYTNSYGFGGTDIWLVKTDASGNMQWSQTYGGAYDDCANSLILTSDGGYALVGYSYRDSTNRRDIYLVKTDPAGNELWEITYGGTYDDSATSLVQMSDGGYLITCSGFTELLKTYANGEIQWTKRCCWPPHYGEARSLAFTEDGGYAIAGWMSSSGSSYDFLLVKTEVEVGLARTGLTDTTITLYRGKTDPYWNYVRVRIWTIEEPSWIYGDINMDGVVDAKDLYIVSRNYGKTFSLLSLSGIVAIGGIQTYKSRKKIKATEK